MELNTEQVEWMKQTESQEQEDNWNKLVLERGRTRKTAKLNGQNVKMNEGNKDNR